VNYNIIWKLTMAIIDKEKFRKTSTPINRLGRWLPIYNNEMFSPISRRGRTIRVFRWFYIDLWSKT